MQTNTTIHDSFCGRVISCRHTPLLLYAYRRATITAQSLLSQSQWHLMHVWMDARCCLYISASHYRSVGVAEPFRSLFFCFFKTLLSVLVCSSPIIMSYALCHVAFDRFRLFLFGVRRHAMPPCPDSVSPSQYCRYSRVFPISLFLLQHLSFIPTTIKPED